MEYEKFTHEEAVYGADHCGADWKDQALMKAKSYLDFSSFSREGLIEQLEYEGFSHDDAVTAVDRSYILPIESRAWSRLPSFSDTSGQLRRRLSICRNSLWLVSAFCTSIAYGFVYAELVVK